MSPRAKSFALMLATSLCAAALWHVSGQLFLGEPWRASVFWQLGILGVAYGALSGVVLALVRPVWWQAGGATTAAVLMVWLTTLVQPAAFPTVLAGAAAFAVLTWYAGFSASSLERDLLRPTAIRLVGRGLPTVLTGFAFALSSVYLASPALSNVKEALIPRAAFETTIATLPLQSIWPGFSVEASVDEFVRATLEREGGAVFAQLPAAQRAGAVRRGREELAQRYGVEVRGGEKLTDVLYRAITDRFIALVGPWAPYVPFILALSFFFAVKFASYPIVWVAQGVSALLVALLVRVGVAKRETIEVTQETIRFS